MHFVTGGAFNGKLNWVLSTYDFTENEDVVIYRCYHKDTKIKDFTNETIAIISGIEFYLQAYEKNDQGRIQFRKDLQSWLDWEMNDNKRQLILIGSDVSKGVVPMRQEDRKFRDFIGWCYQDIVEKASRVDYIWYGLHHTLKK